MGPCLRCRRPRTGPFRSVLVRDGVEFLAEALNIAEAVAAHHDHKSLLGRALLKPILEDLKSRGAERSTMMGPHLLAALDTLSRTSKG